MNDNNCKGRAMLAMAALANAGIAFPQDSSQDSTSAPRTMPTVRVEAAAEAPVEATSTKTGISLLETPQAVSVVTAETLQDRNISDLGQALQRVAGVSASSTYGYYDAYTLRGYDAAYGSLFLDGLTTTSVAGTNNELAGLEQVEVIKGPAAALYGASPLGGIVNLVSKRPTPEAFVETNITTGSYDRIEAHVDANSPLNAWGTLLGRVNLLYRDADDFVDHSGENRVYVAPALTWDVSDASTITFFGRYQQDRDNPWSPLTAYGTVLPSVHGDLPIEFSVNRDGEDRAIIDQERRAAGLVFDHVFDEHISFHQSLRYTRTHTYWNNWVFSDNFVDSSFIDGVQQGQILGLYVYGPFRQTDRDFGVDNHLRMAFESGGFSHRVTLGVDHKRNENAFAEDGGNYDYLANTLDILDPRDTTPLLHDPAAAYGGRGRSRQTGYYVQEHLGLPGERWFVTLGGRWDEAVTDGQKDQAFSPNLGVNYLLTPGVSLYVNASEPFTPQGTWVLDIDGNALPAETGRNYEVGVKWQLPDSSFAGMVSAFQLTRENVATEDPSNPFFYVVTGEQRSRGIEIEGTWKPAPAWTASWAYTWIDAEITADNTLVAGTRLSNVPEHNLFLEGRYQLLGGPLAGLAFTLSGLYNSEKNSSLFPTDIDGDGIDEPAVPLPGYTLVDAGVTYGRDAWQARLTANNILDERYYPDAGYYTRVTPGEPRNWTLSFSYRF
jgi:iron complex outermembrane receptor protein